MLEAFFVLLSFAVGRKMGMYQAINTDITKQTSHMQDLIDKAYEKRDAMKASWLDAEDRAETWQRRYWNLWESISEEDEEDE